MDRQEVLDKIADAAVEVLGVERELVTEDASFKDDLDADSLDLVEFVMAVEESFGISIPEEKLQNITTVGAAVSYVMDNAGAESATAETGSGG
ncbi:MAG TPA: acyl carrier protein [Acidimicrobiales bacterium]|nr:acyl carrier protein [Acidimicrobiales bacterium]